VSGLPSEPGVYWFLDDADTVLYVGKAKQLKNRVSSYTRLTQLQGKTKTLVQTATRLKFQILESELEALFVEAELIRTHQPQFNILLKDDKTPLYIVITRELFPRVLTARKKEIDRGVYNGVILGPFSSAFKVREVLQIARRIFPWCNETGDKQPALGSKACFYHHLQLCPGPCAGVITPEEYRKNIEQLTLFLRGKKRDVLHTIKQDMKIASETEDYETAAILRDRVKVIEAVTQRQYKLKPDLVLPVLKESATEEGLIHLRRLLTTYLNIPKTYPMRRIEGYDVSNTQGTNASVAMVVSIDGKPDTSEYRLFNIRLLDTPNDYMMMKEALVRRQNHPEWGYPDLLVIDGGKGQLRAALSVWQWSCPVISIAKDPDRIIIPVSSLDTDKIEYEVLSLPSHHLALKIVQQLRDEAHRFSKKQHSRRRTKELFR
jgi:excinuclease ABC subunit C